MAIALLVISGLLLGGAISLRNQHAPRTAVVVAGLLSLLALAGGILYLLPKGH